MRRDFINVDHRSKHRHRFDAMIEPGSDSRRRAL